MQRVRIGLTGLAFVFVLVLLGTVFSSASEDDAITASTVEQPLGETAAKDKKAGPKDPLAELGVAPGNVDKNVSGNAAGTAGAPPRGR